MKYDLKNGPLSGYRVIELGSMVSGPFCSRLMADFGAEVIKVEQVDGDPVRYMGSRQKDKSLYAASILRNKDLLALDLHKPAGQAIVKRLVAKSDIVIENFRPGTLEKWGLGYEELNEHNPRIILVRISGFGQTGPYKDRPGYGPIGESISGLRELTGDPDRPPPRMAVSLTDYLCGLYGAFGAVSAALVREQTGVGQIIDSSLYEAGYSLMEPHIPAYSALGIIPERTGSKLSNSSPNNLYPAQDGHIHGEVGTG
jgi:crotonobetainyl-CoA:carnitine CoA-transferase CaiB-like acyl-CoA transferase